MIDLAFMIKTQARNDYQKQAYMQGKQFVFFLMLEGSFKNKIFLEQGWLQDDVLNERNEGNNYPLIF